MTPGEHEEGVRFPTVPIAGVDTALCGRAETVQMYLDWALKRRDGVADRPLLATSMNGQTIYEVRRRPGTLAMFSAFDLVSIDGQPAVLMSKFWRDSFVERVATSDLIHDVARAGVAHNMRHYLLGANAETVAAAQGRLEELYPGIIIAGARDGYWDMSELPAIAADISARRADIVWVCMGVPLEQRVAIQLRELAPSVGVFKTGGGVLDFVSGARPRAPKWLQAIGLEWAFRLCLEPGRLWSRYLSSNTVAFAQLLKGSERERREKVIPYRATKAPGAGATITTHMPPATFDHAPSLATNAAVLSQEHAPPGLLDYGN